MRGGQFPDTLNSDRTQEMVSKRERPRVELGFKPAFLLVKGANVQSGWRIFDATRDPGGQFQKRLYAEGTSAESTNSSQYVDYDDTGFDVEASGSLSTYNVSGKTYVYMAFAQNPGKEVIDSLLDTPTNYEAFCNNGVHAVRSTRG